MAKAVALVSALCILAIATVAHCYVKPETFDVEGTVYCDPCRVLFRTKLSYDLPGALVKLDCRNIDNGTVTFSAGGRTDITGHYSITVEGDHENEICEVKAVDSGDLNCRVPMDGELSKARIVCTGNNGMHNVIRHANPIGFVPEGPVGGCREALHELGFSPGGIPI